MCRATAAEGLGLGRWGTRYISGTLKTLASSETSVFSVSSGGGGGSRTVEDPDPSIIRPDSSRSNPAESLKSLDRGTNQVQLDRSVARRGAIPAVVPDDVDPQVEREVTPRGDAHVRTHFILIALSQPRRIEWDSDREVLDIGASRSALRAGFVNTRSYGSSARQAEVAEKSWVHLGETLLVAVRVCCHRDNINVDAVSLV
jgi:hypothetical protein